MNKYLKAILLLLFYWAIVGTGISIILHLIGFDLGGVGSVIGFALGVYFATTTIRLKD